MNRNRQLVSRPARWLASAIMTMAVLVTAFQPAAAQLDSSRTWRFNITPYGWLPGLTGRVGIGPVSSSVAISTGELLDALKFATMITADARYGRWLVGADGVYALLGAGHVFGIRGDTGSLSLNQSLTILQPMGGYTIGDGSWALDMLASMRIYKLSATLDIDSNTRPPDSHAAQRTWVDATPGLRLRWMPLDDVRFAFYADGGVGGSQTTWQIYSSLGYDLWKGVSLGVAYRVLDVEYDQNNLLYDTKMQGILIGLGIRFR